MNTFFTNNNSRKNILDQRDLQNAQIFDYYMDPIYANIDVQESLDLAMQHPGLDYQQSYTRQKDIDIESDMRFTQCDPRLWEKVRTGSTPSRAYATIPYLGRGIADPLEEFQMTYGAAAIPRRATVSVTEQTSTRDPMIPHKDQARLQKRIDAETSGGTFSRGGVSSRKRPCPTDTNNRYRAVHI